MTLSISALSFNNDNLPGLLTKKKEEKATPPIDLSIKPTNKKVCGSSFYSLGVSGTYNKKTNYCDVELNSTIQNSDDDTKHSKMYIGVKRKPGEYTTPTLTGGFRTVIVNGDGDTVQSKEVDKNGDTVQKSRITYEKDKEGHNVKSTETYYDAKDKKCGSIEHDCDGNMIFKDKNDKVVMKATWNPDTKKYSFVDADGKPMSKEKIREAINSVHPQDSKYKQFTKEEDEAFEKYMKEHA